MERLENIDLDAADQAILSGIEEEMLAGRFEELGEGNFASVVILDRARMMKDPEGKERTEGQVVVKRLKIPEGTSRARRETMLELLRVEMHLQEHARQLVETAKERDAVLAGKDGRAPKQFANIPRPVALMHSDKEIMFVMDRVPGMTLFQKAAKEWLQAMLGDDTPETPESFQQVMNHLPPDRLAQLTRRLDSGGVRVADLPPALAEKRIFGNDLVFALPNTLRQNALRREPADPVMFLQLGMEARSLRTDREFPIVTPEQTEALRNTVTVLNAGGLLHGDLHGNNVMESPNGELTVLDFGAARMSTNSDEEMERRRDRVRETMMGRVDTNTRAVSDMQIVQYMEALSRRRNMGLLQAKGQPAPTRKRRNRRAQSAT